MMRSNESSLTLVRHTRPAIGDGICYGALDLEVADTFESEASIVLANLARPDVLISSPLQRCQRLAASIADAFDLSIITDERVREMDFGSWEGVPWDDIDRSTIDQWSDDFYQARPHGGESVAQLVTRVQSALNDYREAGRHHLIVCHAGVIKAAVSTGRSASDFSTEVAFGGILKLPEIFNE